MRPAKAESIISIIQDEAIVRWGHRYWLASLVREYCKLESEELRTEIDSDSRRNTIARVFKVAATTVATAQRLAQCVRGDLQLVANREVYTDIISGIEETAKERWGEDWKIGILHAYCEVEGIETGTMPNFVNKRTTIRRIWIERSTTLQTACWLAAAVEAEMQMIIHKVEVRRF